MHTVARRSTGRVAAGTLALALLGGCTDRVAAPSARTLTPAASSRDAASGTASYVLLARGNGFATDFASTVASLGGTVVTLHQGAGIAVIDGLSPTAAAVLGAHSDVADIEQDVEVRLDAPVAPVQADMSSTAVVAQSASNPATAILASWQWNMRAIHADAAWAAGALGDPGVTVAILDTGMDYDNRDLNGLVDLSRSTSFVPSDDAIRQKYFVGRNNITDFNGHGTNVAAQVSSKAFAFAGVTSRTTLIGVKVLGYNGVGSTGGVLSGILWAADHGADVANMSLGASFLKTGAGRFTSLLNRVFNYAKQHGMLIVVAAGNAAEDLDHNGNETDAYCDMVHVVCVSAIGPVTATGPADLPAFYSNFGRSAISVAGPGGNLDPVHPTVTNWPWGADFASWAWSFCSRTTIDGFTSAGVPVAVSCASGGRLDGFIGTSQATPHVAGLAALLVAGKGHGQPQQIRNLIERSADDLGQPGTDPYFGHGRINVAKALKF
ncbi:MAG TPA: S8 family serine peptidase [Gemmatimonadaceae bacterium]|jgi:subtilisin family serine protease|nr:S8 family serine peptidase [Gemmatimonadaceae bacterium]